MRHRMKNQLGKLAVDTPRFVIESDATIVLPLILESLGINFLVQTVANDSIYLTRRCRFMAKRANRLWQRLEEHLEQLSAVTLSE